MRRLGTLAFLLVLAWGAYARFSVALGPGGGIDNYEELGLNLSRYGTLGTGRGDEPSARTGALYPALLAASRAGGPRAPLLVQAGLSCAAIALAGGLAALLWSPLAGVLTAALVAVHPSLIASAGRYEVESFYGLLLLAAAWSLAFWLRRPGRNRAVFAGLCVGLSLTCRSVLFLFPVVVGAALWARARTEPAARRHIPAFLLAAYVLLLPWVARNAYHFRAFVPFERGLIADTFSTASLGLTEFPHERGSMDRLAAEWGCADPGRTDCLVRGAWARVAAEPGRYLASCAARLKYAVGLHPWLIAAALVPLVLVRGDLALLSLGLLCAYFVAVYTPFALVARFFDPLLACLLVLGGCAAAAAIEKARGRPARPRAKPDERLQSRISWSVAAAATLLYAANVYHLGREVALRAAPCALTGTVIGSFRCGQEHARLGRTGAAADLYARALELHRKGSGAPPALLARIGTDLGLIRWRADGGSTEALASIDAAVRLDADAVHATAMQLQTAQDEAAAGMLLDRIIRLHPGTAGYLLDRGILSFLRGRRAQGLQDLETAGRLAPTDIRVQYHLGFAREASGRRAPALAAYGEAVRLGESPSGTEILHGPLDRYLGLARAARARLQSPR